MRLQKGQSNLALGGIAAPPRPVCLGQEIPIPKSPLPVGDRDSCLTVLLGTTRVSLPFRSVAECDRQAYTVVQKKTIQQTLVHNFAKYWPIFTDTHSRKFAIKILLQVLPHLNGVAVQPCEILIYKNRIDWKHSNGRRGVRAQSEENATAIGELALSQ